MRVCVLVRVRVHACVRFFFVVVLFWDSFGCILASLEERKDLETLSDGTSESVPGLALLVSVRP